MASELQTEHTREICILHAQKALYLKSAVASLIIFLQASVLSIGSLHPTSAPSFFAPLTSCLRLPHFCNHLSWALRTQNYNFSTFEATGLWKEGLTWVENQSTFLS